MRIGEGGEGRTDLSPCSSFFQAGSDQRYGDGGEEGKSLRGQRPSPFSSSIMVGESSSEKSSERV